MHKGMGMRFSMMGLLWVLLLPAAQAVTLVVPEQLEVLAVDGVAMKRGLFAREQRIELAPGEHELRWQYEDFVRPELGDIDVRVRSEEQVQRWSFPDEPLMKLESARPLQEREAVAFARKPVARLLRANGQEVAALSVPSAAVTAPVAGMPLQQLRYWWGQADDAAKRAFLAEIQPK